MNKILEKCKATKEKECIKKISMDEEEFKEICKKYWEIQLSEL